MPFKPTAVTCFFFLHKAETRKDMENYLICIASKKSNAFHLFKNNPTSLLFFKYKHFFSTVKIIWKYGFYPILKILAFNKSANLNPDLTCQFGSRPDLPIWIQTWPANLDPTWPANLDPDLTCQFGSRADLPI